MAGSAATRISGNGLGMVGGPAAFGNTDPTRHQRTFAHELGHNFGFLHNRAETGIIITTINETGWDTLNRVNLGELKSCTLMDIMVPGLLTHEAWVHPQTYQDVYDDQTNACIVFIPIPIELFTLSAIVPPDPRAEVDHPGAVPADQPDPGAASGGQGPRPGARAGQGGASAVHHRLRRAQPGRPPGQPGRAAGPDRRVADPARDGRRRQHRHRL